MGKKFLFLVFVLSIISLVSCNYCHDTASSSTVPEIKNGFIDLQNWNFSRDGIVTLSGKWLFYWNKHLPPGSDFSNIPANEDILIEVPGVWNGRKQNGEILSGKGYCSYRLKVLLPSQRRHLAIQLLDLATAYRVYVNGNLLFESGIPGKSADSTVPYLLPKVVPFEIDSEQLDILIHVSNFHHRLGGMWESIKLGGADEILARREMSLLFKFFLLGSIIIMGLYHIGLHWNRRDDKAALYFGIFCILMGMRLLSTDQRYILHIIPWMNFEWLHKIIYISFYLCVPLFAMYVKALFEHEVSAKVVFAAQIMGLIFSIVVLLTPALVYSHTMPVFQLFTVVLFGYGAWVVVLLLKSGRSGALVFLFGFTALLVTSLNDILYTRQIIDTGHLFQTGFFIFIFSQTYLIFIRFSEVFSIIENQSSKLKAANIGYEKQLRQRREAEKQLKDSEKNYRLLAENVTDVIWILNLSTLNFDYVSPSIERIQGYTPTEAQELSLEQQLSPESYRKAIAIIEEELFIDNNPSIDKNRSRSIEVEQSIKGGGYIWAEAIASFMRDSNGNPVAIMGVTRDIEARKKAEAEIIESEKKYRNLFENGSDLLCIHDLEGNLIETNVHFKKEYGWTKADLNNLNIREFIPIRHRKKFDRYMENILSSGSAEGYLMGHTKSGKEVVLEYRNNLIYDDKGAPVAVQGAARDVTKRIKAEKALQESEEKYKDLVRYAPAGIYEFDMQKLQFTSVNDVMCKYTGYSEEGFLRLDPFELLSDESKITLKELIEKVYMEKPRELSTEYRVKSKERGELWVLANARFFYTEGIPQRAMVVVHDLTDIRRAEEDRRKLELQLQNAKKLESLGTLAGGVAHDLNNILSAIVSYPDLILLDLETDSPLRAPLIAIKQSGEKAAEIVHDLLTLARRGVDSRKVIDLNRIVNGFLRSPEYEKILEANKSICIKTDLQETLLNIVGSEVHISKSLMNLVANAADAMPAGGEAKISTKSLYLDTVYKGYERIPEGEYTILQISDMGIGISSSDLEQIFEPFYTKKIMGRSGTGLGMSVVWGTIKDHSGFIDINSQEGSGTTFSLYFPASRSEIEAHFPVYIEDYLGRGESLLIIDDSPEQRKLAMQMMQRLGYEVHTTSSGEEAVALVKKRPYDLLILDMIMPPGIDGLETYKKILEIAPDQKAVIASGYAENENVREAQRIGAGSYIKKPYTLERIGLAIRAELDLAGSDN